MKSIFAALVAGAAIVSFAAPQVDPLGQSLTVPANSWGYVPLANTVSKLKAGGRFTVAVVGDSIGYGQGVVDVTMQGVTYGCRPTFNRNGMPKANPMGYARLFTDYVKSVAKSRYGIADKDIDVFYAVWGGATTKSTFGYFCDDIIARRPDLILMEIWNDCPETAVYADSVMRTLWKNLPETDLIMLGVGNVFSRGPYTDPLQKRYGVPLVNAHRNIDAWLGNFGKVHDNNYGIVSPDGRVSGTRGYFYGNSSPHVHEEGYAYWCTLLFRDFGTLLDGAEKDAGGVRRVVPAEVLDKAEAQGKGVPCLYSKVLTPSVLKGLAVSGADKWTVSADEVKDEPRDTPDRAGHDKLIAAEKGDTLSCKVSGYMIAFRGVDGMSVSTDGGKTFAPVKGELVIGAEGDADATVVFRADKKGAWLNECYLYARTFKPVAPNPGKHRWSVRYHARLDSKYVHDWHLNGMQVLPKPIIWLNCFRDETYTKPLKVAGESVIHSDCMKPGKFIGWVEATEVRWDGGTRIPVVKSGAKPSKIYAPGSEIDVNAIGRDLDLVAYFGDAVVPEYTRTIKASFVTENSTRGVPVAILDAPEADPVIVLPAAPVRNLFKFNGWKKVNGSELLHPGSKVKLDTDTEFVADWSASADTNGMRLSDAGCVLDYVTRVGDLSELFNSTMSGRKMGSSRKLADGSFEFKAHAHTIKLSADAIADQGKALRIEAKGGSYWQFPEFFAPAPVPMKLRDLKKVVVKYAYASSNPANLVGQHMTLHINTRTADGLAYVRSSVVSSGTIALCDSGTLEFVIPDSAKKPNVIDSEISDVSLQFYDINQIGRPAKTPLAFNNGDVLKLGEFSFVR